MARLTAGMELEEGRDERGGVGGDVDGGVCGEIGDEEVVGRHARHDVCPIEMGREEAMQEENSRGLVVIE